jgi:hypothetical protein
MPDQKLLLSMELFCAAGLEPSQRAVFLGLVSALEPLAQTANLGRDVSSFVDECLCALEADPAIPQETKNSLKGRLGQLRGESIRQALLRLVRNCSHEHRRTAHN